MSEVYIISYYEYPLSMSGRGKDKVIGYFESKYDACEYLASKNTSCDYGEYRCDKAIKLEQGVNK